MENKSIEEIYDNIQKSIINDIGNDEHLTNLCNKLNKLDELIKNTLSTEDYQMFDEDLPKKAK